MRVKVRVEERYLKIECRLLVPDRSVSGYVRFIIDTGAYETILSEAELVDRGIDFDSLPVHDRPLGTIGGWTDPRILGGVILEFLGERGEAQYVEMDEIFVVRNIERRARGGRVKKLVIPNLLGLGMIYQTGARLVIDGAKKTAYLEF